MRVYRDDQKFLQFRINALIWAIAAVFVFLAGSFWFVQGVQADKYRGLAEANSLRALKMPAKRGLIMDRNGKILADNQPAYSLVLDRIDHQYRMARGFGFNHDQYRLGRIGRPPLDAQPAADMLHGRAAQRAADLVDPVAPLQPVGVQGADLQEFVAVEREIDFLEHSGREAGFPYDHYRMQSMSAGRELPALRRRDFGHQSSVT